MTRSVVYHAVPENMQGTVLYPRNELAKSHPEMAAAYTEKYVGREEVAETHIPTLDCNWGDVLFMSPVHPQTVIDTMRVHGAPTDFRLQAYKVPIDMLDMDKLTVMVTESLGDDGKRFLSYDQKHLKSWQTIPQITLDHDDKMVARGEQPYTYGGIPHFLYKGSIDITGLNIVETH